MDTKLNKRTGRTFLAVPRSLVMTLCCAAATINLAQTASTHPLDTQVADPYGGHAVSLQLLAQATDVPLDPPDPTGRYRPYVRPGEPDRGRPDWDRPVEPQEPTIDPRKPTRDRPKWDKPRDRPKWDEPRDPQKWDEPRDRPKWDEPRGPRKWAGDDKPEPNNPDKE